MQIRILRAAAITSFKIMTVPSNVEPMFALLTMQNDSSTPAPRALPPFGAGEIAVCSYRPIDCLVFFLVTPIVIADDRVSTGSSKWQAKIRFAVGQHMAVWKIRQHMVWNPLAQYCFVLDPGKNRLACSANPTFAGYYTSEKTSSRSYIFRTPRSVAKHIGRPSFG